jgi:hypothetical protein
LNRAAGCLALLFAALPRATAAQAVRDSTGPGRAVVTAVTLGLVYVGAGRNDGLREGTVVRVPRLGEKAAYRVIYLSSKSAAVRGDSLAPLPAVGDSVLFQPVAQALASTGTGKSDAPGATGARRRPLPGLRGRVGLRYLGSWDRSSDIALKQPGLELRLDGPVAPGAPVGLNVDIRSRRTSMYRPGLETETSEVMGVYQAALRIQSTEGPVRAVLGRQYAPTLAGVGLFDGMLLDYQRPRWGAGVMAGLAPDQGTLAVSSEIRQVGVFFQGRNRPSAPVRWNLTVGGMGSYAAADVNREFGFLQATLNSRVVSAVLLQELDVNRGWKIAAGEPRFSLTSTYASINLTPARGVALSGGYDGRRNIRLYRDLTTPEEVFDDRFRRGYWAGANFTIARKLRIGGDARVQTVDGADSLGTTAYSATMSVDQISPLGLGLRMRATRYTTPGRGPGTLVVGGLRLSPGSLGSMEINGGARQEDASPGTDRFWAGLDAEVFLRRSWFLLATFTREWGRGGLTPTTDLLYGGLSWRF